MRVVPEPPLGEARPATSWSCNFFDATGESFTVEGRFPEAPVGWDPYTELETVVTGQAPTNLLGAKRVRLAKSAPEVREYLMYEVTPESVRYDFNFQFVRDARSLATVTRYTPPSGDKLGQIAAFATGHCLSKFHAVGEKEAGS